MKTSVLEFKIFDELFCLNTSHIEYVFELDDFTPLKAFHKSVIGIVKYNDDVMLLLDTATLYSDKSLNLSTPKSVIVLKDNSGSHFGLLVDEIIKIEDVEIAITGVKLSIKETTINHYKAKDMIVNEIDPIPLLEKYNIPSMSKPKKAETESNDEAIKEKDRDFLLFSIGANLYAAETLYVREVIENSSNLFPLDDKDKKIKGTIALRDEIIKIADIDKPKNPEDIVVMEVGDKSFGIEVDEIKDIESFEESKLEYIEDRDYFIKAFYNYKKRVVAIINPDFYIKNSLKNKKQTNSSKKEGLKSTFLIFKIQDTQFALSLEQIRRVVETDTLPKTKSSSIIMGKNTKFISTWNKRAVAIISLEHFLNLKNKKSDTQAIFVEADNKIAAFVADEINDIIMIDKKRVNSSKENSDKIISGAIIYKDTPIPIINTKNIVTME